LRRLTVEVVSERPHDPRAFTQGLLLREGKLYESTGGFGTSSLRRVEPRTGEVEARVELPDRLFGEGLAEVGDRLIQLTWQAGEALVWDAESLEALAGFRYEGEGWGLCFDGDRLVMSDGSDRLTFRNPTTFEIEGRVRVSVDGRALGRLNELECLEGWVWANIWQADQIVRIDPFTGRVDTVVDASGLLSTEERSQADVLNGIAWDPENRTWQVTGKLWPKLFEVRFVEP
jgi:glutamine cyclotransferase